MNVKQLFNISKRSFGLYNYASPANPRVFMTIANGEKKLGQLVFELYAEQQPQTAESFSALCDGADGSLVGTNFHHG